MNSRQFEVETEIFCKKHPNWQPFEKQIKLKKSFLDFDAEFTILLHPLYQVPVLYFLVMKVSIDEHGFSVSKLATLEEIPFLKSVNEQTISFGENPTSGQVMYFLHPCQTAEFMSGVMRTCPHASYLESWYSFVNQVMNLEE